ncbi:MAG: hypothetical protein ACK4K7_04340 [Allosphingosinicella sp.]|uniref:hypothetical protein n=1 Tax=Allosphingosinicella sp. TaxID=2823234 RepID=UPI003952D9E8
MDWLTLKDWLGEVTGLGEDALHIYAALVIQLTAALVLRRSLASPLPWLCVLAVLLVNEWLDITLPEGPVERWQIDGGIQDLWNTMLLPTVLLLMARYAPGLMVAERKGASEPAERDEGSIL